MLISLSLAGWSFLVAALSVAVSLAGFVASTLAIRAERSDRREALADAWAREWAAQRPLVYPRLPDMRVGAPTNLRLKNGGRGPALNVEGDLTIREDDNVNSYGGIIAGTIAADDEEIGRLTSPQIAPPWSKVSGELRYMDLVGGRYVTRFDFQRGSGGELELVLHPQEHLPAL